MSGSERPPTPVPQPETPTAQPDQGGTGLATAGFVLGVLGLLLSWIPVLNVVGIVLGVVGVSLAGAGLAKARRTGSGRGLSIAGAILGGLAIVVAIIVNVASVSAISDAIDDAAEPLVDELTPGLSDGTPSPQVSVTDSADSEPDEPMAEGPAPSCSYMGTDGLMDDMHVELVFTNPLGEVNGLEVTYALLDGEDGARFHTGTAGGLDLVTIKFPSTNEQFRLYANTGESVPTGIDDADINCSVLEIKENATIGGYHRASDMDTCEITGVDSSGSIQVEISVTNPYEETADVQTWWALQAPGPVTFAADTEVVDLVGDGERFTIIPRYGQGKPEWVDDAEVSCVVLGFWKH